MQEESLQIDFLQDYILEKQLPKNANFKKTLYYRYNDDKEIFDYTYYIKVYANHTHEISELSESKKYVLRKRNNDLISVHLEDIFIEKIRNKDMQLEVNVDNVNTLDYSSIVIDDINNEKHKIVINPFTDILKIFNGDYSLKILFSMQIKEQKIVNYLNNNNEYNKFINNIYNYKLISMKNTLEKCSINKDIIRKEYTLLIQNIIKKINKW